jgi:type II secretory pathway pseudopilin PulG
MKNKNLAFTLAEVLITLGVIGVVSAMTIPTLINKCQKVVLAKQAQKEYAMWTQVFKRILADDNTTSLSATEAWSKIVENPVIFFRDPVHGTASIFLDQLAKYVKISYSNAQVNKKYYDKDNRSTQTTYNNYFIYLANGAQIFNYSFFKNPKQKTDEVCKNIKALGGSMCSYIAYFYIDINGDKGPNIMGRDIFWFFISDEGILYPYGGKDYALFGFQTDLASNSIYWKKAYSGTKEQNAKKVGELRAGQLMEEGWKMTY